MAEEKTEASGAGEETGETAAAEGQAAHQEAEPRSGNGQRRPRAKGAYFLSFLALLAGLGALAGGGYVYWQWQARWGAVEGRFSAQGQRLEQLQQQLGQQRKDLKKTRQDLAARVDGLKARLDRAQDRTAELARRLEGGRSYWVLERAEGLLRTADRLSRLEGDPEAAHSALEAADAALSQLGDTDWLTVRQAIQEGMTRLEQIPRPDTPGIALKLSSLTRTALDLPLRGTSPREPGAMDGAGDGEGADEAAPRGIWGHVRAFFRSFWADLQGLVRLRRAERPAEPLLPPKQAQFLRHNLVLTLQSARLAALRGEAEVYEQSLADARDWLGRYFAEDHPAVRGVRESLSRLADKQVTRSFPDMSRPLERFRQVRQEQRR